MIVDVIYVISSHSWCKKVNVHLPWIIISFLHFKYTLLSLEIIFEFLEWGRAHEQQESFIANWIIFTWFPSYLRSPSHIYEGFWIVNHHHTGALVFVCSLEVLKMILQSYWRMKFSNIPLLQSFLSSSHSFYLGFQSLSSPLFNFK